MFSNYREKFKLLNILEKSRLLLSFLLICNVTAIITAAIVSYTAGIAIAFIIAIVLAAAIIINSSVVIDKRRTIKDDLFLKDTSEKEQNAQPNFFEKKSFEILPDNRELQKINLT